MKQWKVFSAFLAVFLVAYFLPLSNSKVSGAILEACKMLQWYARNHTLACVVPAAGVQAALTKMGLDAEVTKVTDINEITSRLPPDTSRVVRPFKSSSAKPTDRMGVFVEAELPSTWNFIPVVTMAAMFRRRPCRSSADLGGLLERYRFTLMLNRSRTRG